MSKNTEKPNKASSADYPVDPAERMNQELRLKKAAAAGVIASRSPLSALMLQTGSPAAATQKTPAQPEAAAPTPARAIETVAESPEHQEQARVNYEEVLAELRKISAWADLQRRITRWSLILLAVFIPVAIGAIILAERNLNTKLEANLSSHEPDWYDVDHSVRLGDFDKAIATGEQLILKTPQDPEAHQRLAKAYLAAGDVEKAKEHYAEAYRLFPSEQNEKLLDALEKRVTADKPPSSPGTPN